MNRVVGEGPAADEVQLGIGGVAAAGVAAGLEDRGVDDLEIEPVTLAQTPLHGAPGAEGAARQLDPGLAGVGIAVVVQHPQAVETGWVGQGRWRRLGSTPGASTKREGEHESAAVSA